MKAQIPSVTGISGERKDADIFKAFIPNFLYKPPFGMPRRDNPPQYKQLASNPYVFSVIKTLCDQAASNHWDIRVKDEFQDDGVDYAKKIKEIKRFIQNPNGNEESFAHILRQLITDLLEVDSAVIVKVFNSLGELQQIFARDGSLFLKNTDIYGYIGNRADFVLPLPDGFSGVAVDVGGTPTTSQQQIMKQYSLLYKEQAAYFQYGWTAGSMPVPFGKREIIYMMQSPRADSIYGVSPISRMIEVILNLIYGADFNLDFYTNNNMPDGAISLLGANQKQISQFGENFRNQFKFKDELGNERKRFFTHPITSTDVKFTPFTLSAKEMEVIAQQEWFTKILWMSFGVNADEMGFTQDSNKTSGDAQIKNAKKKAIKPLLDVIAYHLNTQLITEFFTTGRKLPNYSDVPLEFVFDEFDIEEDIKELQKLKMEIDMGIKTAEMVAMERGIDIKELQESKQEAMDKEVEQSLLMTPPVIEGNPKPKDKEPVKEKAVEPNPLDELDSYFDKLGDEISNAVGKINEREIRV